MLYWILFAFTYGSALLVAVLEGWFSGKNIDIFELSVPNIAIFMGSSSSTLFLWMLVKDSFSKWLSAITPRQGELIHSNTVDATVFISFVMVFLLPYFVLLASNYLYFRSIVRRIKSIEKKIEAM